MSGTDEWTICLEVTSDELTILAACVEIAIKGNHLDALMPLYQGVLDALVNQITGALGLDAMRLKKMLDEVKRSRGAAV